jgi:hypothetical protein
VKFLYRGYELDATPHGVDIFKSGKYVETETAEMLAEKKEVPPTNAPGWIVRGQVIVDNTILARDLLEGM